MLFQEICVDSPDEFVKRNLWRSQTVNRNGIMENRKIPKQATIFPQRHTACQYHKSRVDTHTHHYRSSPASTPQSSSEFYPYGHEKSKNSKNCFITWEGKFWSKKIEFKTNIFWPRLTFTSIRQYFILRCKNSEMFVWNCETKSRNKTLDV